MMKFLNLMLSSLTIVLAASSYASDDVLHIRGEVTAINGDDITVTSRNGSSTHVNLSDQTKVLDVTKVTLSSIKDNSYVGVASTPAAQGKLRALGIMVFPEGARGLNEGQFPWDKGNKSTMTNATVAGLARKTNSTELEVRFNEKLRTVVVDNETVIGQFVPGQRSLIAQKLKVMIFAHPGANGAAAADMVMVGRNGFLPPI